VRREEGGGRVEGGGWRAEGGERRAEVEEGGGGRNIYLLFPPRKAS
jgi:hypothetical protein